MQFKYMGPDDEITLRGVTFKKAKAVDVDESLAAKISVLDYFKAVKPRAKRNDKNTD